MSKKRLTVKATPQGLALAQNALKRLGGTQLSLAKKLTGLVGRSTIQKFFQGEEIQVDKFREICRELLLEWQWEAIAGLTDLPTSVDVSNNSPEQALEEQDSSIDIDDLVKEVREKIKPYIKERCGTMRVLDMTQPIGLGDIYTDVNILEKITGRSRREIAELLQNFTTENFDRFGLGKVTQERVPGLQAVQQHSKLMVLGKPGAGKSTFLKYLAMQCIEGQFQKERFPIFITLKYFAEAPEKPSIPKYITKQLSNGDLTDADVKAQQLLKQGKVLVLLDGLDEVREEDNSRVIRQIRDFTEQHRENQIVVTCRIAAKEYVFERFVEVEIADFNDLQIASFANKWFQVRNPGKEEKFIEKLKENEPIKELATNPLLLTLLCLIFEEKGKFKNNRSELYEEGIELLLEKWDNSREIEREEIYINLSTRRKEDLLSKIALETFESGNYFFKNREAEGLIYEYIYNLPDAKTSTEANSRRILKSIEAQHGLLVERAKAIYSFSHLTFHEYFTAREIKERSAWARLAEHVTQKRWREVFLLTVEMVRNADDLLKSMKQKIDALLAKDEELQKLLIWVEQKSKSVEALYKPGAVRALYLSLSRDRDLDPSFSRDLSRDLDLYFSCDRDLDPSFSRDFSRDLDLYFSCDRDFDLSHYLSFSLSRNLDLDLFLSRDFDPELERSLQHLKDQLPDAEDQEVYKQWWQENGEAWTEQLRSVMIEHRNIGYDWQFSDEQQKLLQQYYDANKLLVDCLNSDCYVSREVRQEIEDTLLLPVNKSPDLK